MKTQEIEEYRRFTSVAECHKAINMLKGLVAGISSDGTVSGDEAMELTHWCSLHANLRHLSPFNELYPVVESALADGVIDPEEKEDILWLCSRVTGIYDFYDDTAFSIQYLHGLVHGILADGELSDAEIHALRKWIDDNEFLSGTYPFDEICALVYTILADRVITQEERDTLKAFFGTVVEFKDSYNLVEADYKALQEKYTVKGICALCPNIEFEGSTFVFTGESNRATRQEIVEIIESMGGIFRSAVSGNTDYLVVGNEGNPCWAFACYGRKIEKAITLRKGGAKVCIVNENDFWDAIDDVKG